MVHISNKVNNNILYEMSNGKLSVISFVEYLKNLFLRILLKIAPISSKKRKKAIDNLLVNIYARDAIIIISRRAKSGLLKVLDIFERDTRVILWFWDAVDTGYTTKPQAYRRIECWSFDLLDCEKYGMKYNTQMYYDVLPPLKNVIEDKDIFYIGNDRNRSTKINEYLKELNDFKLDMIVVKDKTSKDKDYSFLRDEGISYECSLERLASAKAVLEVLCEGQSGVTLRCMEGLYYKKKIITDNKSISKYSIYNPNNIFIIGVDEWGTLHKFLETPFEDYDENILNEYRIGEWLKRFG